MNTSTQDYQSIGIICWGLMGDVLMRTPVIRAFRQIFPNATIVAMVDFLRELSGHLTTMVANRDVQMAETIIAGDDALDKLHEKIFELVEGENWKGTRRQLIDVVLLSRFIERIGDHCVAVARQIVFIVSGFDPSKKPEPDKDTVVA